jgi:predicted O-methyltransferase YrrM
MIYRVLAYIKFFIKSTNQHGVHSPFVYDLVTKCFYDNSKLKAYSRLKSYQKRLKRCKHKLEITDLGAGSTFMTSNTRTVSAIARNSGTTLKRSQLLHRLIPFLKIKNTLELGTSLGFASQAMALANSNGNITTIEGCPNISEYTKTNFELEDLNNIHQLTGDFKDILKDLTQNSYDLIYFDGNHQKEATLDYFETMLPTIHNDSLFIFDDIYWSKDMTQAWDIIKNHPQVSVTIDTFFWGFVFFRKEQRKEHFTIRV